METEGGVVEFAVAAHGLRSSSPRSSPVIRKNVSQNAGADNLLPSASPFCYPIAIRLPFHALQPGGVP